MAPRVWVPLSLLLVALGMVVGPRTAESGSTSAAAQSGPEAYTVLEKYCSDCHPTKGNKAYDVLKWDSLTKTTPSDRIRKKYKDVEHYVVPSKPEKSLIWLRVKNKEMPPKKSDQPSQAEKEVLEKWIKAGAPKAGFAPKK